MAEKKDKDDFQATYAVIERKYKLPPFETVNKDFDIDTIDPTVKHPVKEVAKKIFERIELFKKILETLLQPDVSLLSMQEVEYLSEVDHELVADILRRFMKLDRSLLLGELENDEAIYSIFIKDAVLEWAQVKKELNPLIQHMINGWSTKHKIKQHHQYLG